MKKQVLLATAALAILIAGNALAGDIVQDWVFR